MRASPRLEAASKRARLRLRGGAASLFTPCSPHAGAVGHALDVGGDVSIGDVVFSTRELSPARRADARTRLDTYAAQAGCAAAPNACPPFRLLATESDSEVHKCSERAVRVPCGTRVLDILRGLRERGVVDGVDYGDLNAKQHAALAAAVAKFKDVHGVVARVVVLVLPSGTASIKACEAAL